MGQLVKALDTKPNDLSSLETQTYLVEGEGESLINFYTLFSDLHMYTAAPFHNHNKNYDLQVLFFSLFSQQKMRYIQCNCTQKNENEI